MEEDFVSIIMPVYNCENYIKSAIISIKEQTFQNWMLIIIDDGSTDNTLKYIKEEIEDIKHKVKLIELATNTGVANARNIGIEQAKGKYIAFLDADDFWKKEKLEKQIHFMKANNYNFTFTSFIYLKKDKQRKIGKIPDKLNYKESLKNTIILTSTVMININEIDLELLKMPNINCEDTATWWKILRNNEIGYGLNEELTVYRIRKNSLSNNKFKTIKSTWDIYRKIEKLNLLYSAYCFNGYIINAIKKRIKAKR